LSVSYAQESSPLAAAEPGACAGAAGVCKLVEMLSRVADPRAARGIRHGMGTVLAVTVFAVLAGARNFREAEDRAADLPPELLALAGCRVHPVTGCYVVPSEPTIRRIAHDIDTDAADEQVCRWMREQAKAAAIAASSTTTGAGEHGLIGLAIDGKVVRNTVSPGDPEGSEVKLFSAMLHAEAIVNAQLRVPDGTNEITQVQALLAGIDLAGVVVTGDAAHAQHTTAAHLTAERGGEYALTVKGNQPTLLAQSAAALPAAVPGTEHHLDNDHGKGRIVAPFGLDRPSRWGRLSRCHAGVPDPPGYR
jgi:DDE_Tnp_1-associated/Transposase DDE domain